MPSSMLFGISTEGKVYGLSTNGKKWREFPYLGLEFKKISSVPSFLWALGGDRQIYLHVHSLDIPIRIKEEVYENERWFPIEGFGKRLLPTDRYHWSNKDGTVERRKENIRLPSMAWQWESDWQLELTLDGYPLDFDGWTYAIDFPATYVPTKQWTSCVRRRKWHRYRRYGAMYAWCAIPPLHKDPTKEPFIDVCIGGYSKLDENKRMLSVWAVTVYGRIMFRNGVSTECPDGTRWLSVPSPKNSEVKSASCSAIGVLWIVLEDGGAAVRYGISSQCLTGETWLEVSPPEKNLKLVQISAGLNSVWAMTNDNRVWFRKGIRADRSHASEELLKGSGWIEMVTEMISISVSAHDQVFAINKKDKRIYYRSGVDSAELTGRKWRLIEARTQANHPSSVHSSLSSLPNDSGNDSMTSENADEKTSRSAPPYAKFDAMLLTEPKESKIAEKYEIDSSFKMRSWSPIRVGGSLLAMEAVPGSNDYSLDSDTQKQVFREKDDLTIGCQKQKTLWGCVCAGAVTVDALNLPKWFIEESVIEDYDEKEPWRSKILMKLKNRNLSESEKFDDYETAIETTSWVKSGKFKIHLPGSQVLVECIVELEWIENNATGPDSGTLSVLSCNRETSLLQLSLSEITCILNRSEPGQPCFTVNTSKTVATDTTPLKCFFISENDFEDWLHCVSTVCNQVNGLSEIPHERSVWCTTRLGDIYVSDAEHLKKNQATENGRFAKEYSVKNFFESFKISLLNGFPNNSEITINGYVPANADKFFINLVCGTSDDIAFHLNPRFIEQKIVRNSNINKRWGPEETEGNPIIQPGSDFTITVLCLEKKYKIFINGLTYTYYQHRISPETITDLQIGGQVDVFTILYETDKVILNLHELIWRKIEGNLHEVETCSAGITWGLGYNCVPWIYTGSGQRNGSKGDGDNSSSAKYTMINTKEMYVYENQRWNPLTGFTTRGLPTDRYMWSDESGREKLSKDSIKLQTHWQWANEWQIDYKTPGGVDQDGWQYAVDFPASYHPHNNITDTVRRRRWVRTCRIVIPNSPWQEIGNTKLKDVSLNVLDNSSNPKSIAVWGVTINGEVLYRSDVTTEYPSGERWEHVEIDQSIKSISVGGTRQVWCCGDNGVCFWRFGITTSNPIGENWQYVEPITGCLFHKVAVGKWTVWALDTKGDLYIRKEITPVFPEGTHWRKVQNNDNHKFKHVSASEEFIWAVTNEGVICRRIGISEEYPEGLSWIYGLSGDWLHLSEK